MYTIGNSYTTQIYKQRYKKNAILTAKNLAKRDWNIWFRVYRKGELIYECCNIMRGQTVTFAEYKY